MFSQFPQRTWKNTNIENNLFILFYFCVHSFTVLCWKNYNIIIYTLSLVEFFPSLFLLFCASRKFSTDKFNDQQQLYSLITSNNSFCICHSFCHWHVHSLVQCFIHFEHFCTTQSTILHLISIVQLIIHRKKHFNIVENSKSKHNRFALAFV